MESPSAFGKDNIQPAAGETGTPASCPACGHGQTAGSICMHCGEKLYPTRLTMKQLARDVPDVFFDVDQGLFYTMRKFLTQPGNQIRKYFAGHRMQHYKPLKYVLFIGGLNAFIYAKVPITNGTPQSPLEAFGTQWNTLLLLLQFPLIALATWIIFRNRKYTYGEHFVANAFIIGEVSLFSIVLFPLRYFLNGTPEVIIGDILYLSFILGYYSFVFFDWFYDRKGWKRFAICFGLVFVLTVVVLLFTLVMQVILYYLFMEVGWT